MNYQALYFWKSLKGHLSDLSRNKSTPISVNLLTIRNFIINEINQHKTKQRVQLDNYSIIHVSINWNIG